MYIDGYVLHLSATIPFLLAAVYYSISPLLTKLTREYIEEHYKRLQNSWEGEPAKEFFLAPSQIAERVDWIVDFPQLAPTILLPLAGALYISEATPLVGTTVAAVIAIGAVLANLFLYSVNPVSYRNRTFLKYYTFVPLMGISLNVLVGLLVLVVPLTKQGK